MRNKPLAHRAALPLLLLTLFSSGNANAQTQNSADCDPERKDLGTLLDNEPSCLKDSRYILALGHLLNLAHRYPEAADRLEAALMLQPEHWQAKLEYAIALQGSGDAASASALITQLRRESGPSLNLKSQLDQLTPLTPRPIPGRTLSLGISLGHDDNVFGATRHSQLQLTFPGGDIPVSITANGRPQSSPFLRIEVIHQNTTASLLPEALPLTSHQLRYTLAGSYRWTPEVNNSDIAYGSLNLEAIPVASHGLYARAATQHLARDQHRELSQNQLSAGWLTPSPLNRLNHFSTPGINIDCHFRITADTWRTRHPVTPILDGTYQGIALAHTCPNSGWDWQIRHGNDRPQSNERPGQQQQQTALRLGKYTRLGNHHLNLDYEYYHQQDKAGYSPILQNNTPRRIERQTWRLEYRWTSRTLTPYIALEWIDQRANLDLFSPRNLILSTGLRGYW